METIIQFAIDNNDFDELSNPPEQYDIPDWMTLTSDHEEGREINQQRSALRFE